MRARDWFLVGLRLFSVWVLYNGFTYLFYYFAERVEMLLPASLERDLTPTEDHGLRYLMMGLAEFLFALGLMVYGEQLAGWLFPEPPRDASSEGPGTA